MIINRQAGETTLMNLVAIKNILPAGQIFGWHKIVFAIFAKKSFK